MRVPTHSNMCPFWHINIHQRRKLTQPLIRLQYNLHRKPPMNLPLLPKLLDHLMHKSLCHHILPSLIPLHHRTIIRLLHKDVLQHNRIQRRRCILWQRNRRLKPHPLQLPLSLLQFPPQIRIPRIQPRRTSKIRNRIFKMTQCKLRIPTPIIRFRVFWIQVDRPSGILNRSPVLFNTDMRKRPVTPVHRIRWIQTNSFRIPFHSLVIMLLFKIRIRFILNTLRLFFHPLSDNTTVLVFHCLD
mmetsp:Transcript_5680/g.11138  ORF Transcript_5680/g.11138 Transcript_5680/m.11138 type:complete len:242 (-) Transcript_5680:35-760(-)